MAKYTILQNSAEHHKFKADTKEEAIDYFKEFIFNEKSLYSGDTFRLVKHYAIYTIDESKMELD